MSIVLNSINVVYSEAEAAIRTMTQLFDTEIVSSDLVQKSFEMSERELKHFLKTEYLNSTDMALLDGKHMLASSYLLRSLATNQGVNLKIQRLGNVQENNSDKPQNLISLAQKWAEQAWNRLAPFCHETPEDVGIELLVRNESCS